MVREGKADERGRGEIRSRPGVPFGYKLRSASAWEGSAGRRESVTSKRNGRRTSSSNGIVVKGEGERRKEGRKLEKVSSTLSLGLSCSFRVALSSPSCSGSLFCYSSIYSSYSENVENSLSLLSQREKTRRRVPPSPFPLAPSAPNRPFPSTPAPNLM